MTKRNLKVGMLVVTANGKNCLVLPTIEDGLVLVSEDNKMLKVDKMGDDLTRNRYREGNDVVRIYDIMSDVDGEVFTAVGRDLLYDKETGVDNFTCNGDCVACDETDCIGDDRDDCDCDCDFDYDDDEDCDGDCEVATGGTITTGTISTDNVSFSKTNVQPGMLAVTRDGKNRLAIPTSDMGLVLADEDSKFVRLDKLNNDLTIRDYRNPNKNVDKVYGAASGVTTDFFSTDNRPVLFER